MKQTRPLTPGSVPRAERNIRNGLHPSVQPQFQSVLQSVRRHLDGSNLELSAPASEKWITVKLHPRKAVLAFRQDDEGNLQFDIDTYAHNDITDPRGLFQTTPNPRKPNKRHVASLTPNTSREELAYFIAKMIEGMRIFENVSRS